VTDAAAINCSRLAIFKQLFFPTSVQKKKAGLDLNIRNLIARRNSNMLKKLAMAGVLAFVLSPAMSFAQVHITVAPPAPVVEVRGNAPGPEYVWVDGYHRWEGDHYVWTAGHWDRPPHPHAHWVAHRWVHRHGEWVMVEGHWR
jgi:hypothetical protein